MVLDIMQKSRIKMTEYSDTEKKELEDYSDSLQYFQTPIGEVEKILKKPLEYVPIQWPGRPTNQFIKQSIESTLDNFDNIAVLKKNNVKYLCDIEFDFKHYKEYYFPVRESKGKYLKRLWLKYFH
jgi:hypothetical protein